MKFKQFRLKEGNHFIAMEYYGLILNRTLLVLITEEYLIGVKVRGLISIDTYQDPFTHQLAIKDDLNNPYSYIKNSYLDRIENMDIFGEEIVNIKCSNFRISRQKIKNVTYDKRKKWGMGYYPHDGKVYVKPEKGRKKEFIILGSQSGGAIKNWIERK